MNIKSFLQIYTVIGVIISGILPVQNLYADEEKKSQNTQTEMVSTFGTVSMKEATIGSLTHMGAMSLESSTVQKVKVFGPLSMKKTKVEKDLVVFGPLTVSEGELSSV